MKANLVRTIRTLTPSLETFLIGLNSYNNGETPKNKVFNNFVSRINTEKRSGELYQLYKSFVKDCCILANKTNRRAFEVVDEITIIL